MCESLGSVIIISEAENGCNKLTEKGKLELNA